MSGPITDLPLAVCRWCKATWLIDEREYQEPERCPKCGRRPGEGETVKGEDIKK